MKRFYVTGMALLMGISFAVGGCKSPAASMKETAAPIGTVTPAPGASYAASSAPAVSAAATAAPSPSAAEAGTIRARLSDFALTDERHGFAWGLAAGDVFRLYRTDDAGTHWKEITPGDGSSPVSVTQSNRRSITALDSQHLWVAFGEKDQSPILYSTSDGGAGWTKLSFPPDGFLVASSRVSKDLGYMLTSADAAMGHSEKSLFVTKDGGQSWKKIMENGGYIPTKGETPNAIPQSGHSNKGMTFKDAANGWVPLESPDEKLQLYRTKDGGHNWFKVDLPVPQTLAGCSLSVTSAPSFFGTEKKEGWFPAVCRKPDSDVIFGYFTQDGGELWQPVIFGAGIPVKPSAGIVSVFISRQEGWVQDGTNLQHTLDGGKTWIPLPDQVLNAQLKNFPNTADLQFVTSKAGWMLLEAADGKKSVLLRTADGGRSWQVL